MTQYEYCFIDLVEYEKHHFTSEGIIVTEIKRNKDAGLTKKEASGIEVANMGIEGWSLVNVICGAKHRFYFQRELK
jgi:hypothetical protein